MIAKAGQKINMKSGVSSQSPIPNLQAEWTCVVYKHNYNHQDTRIHNLHPISQSRIKDGHEIMSMITVVIMLQLTCYDCQSKMSNQQGIMSVTTATNMPEYSSPTMPE